MIEWFCLLGVTLFIPRDFNLGLFETINLIKLPPPALASTLQQTSIIVIARHVLELSKKKLEPPCLKA